MADKSTPEEKARYQDLEIKDVKLIFLSVMQKLENEVGKSHLRFPKEIIWLGGAPGAGKGTNTPFIQRERGFTAEPVVISALLDSEDAQRIKNAGGMVGDREVMGLLFRELLKPDYESGVIVDGFPRTPVQVQCLKLLYYKILELHNEFYDTNIGDYFRFPIFRITVLFVEERVSVERQLKRGTDTKIENENRRTLGLLLLEERKTDFDENLARNRYRVFKEQTFEALQSLSQDFYYHIINAQASIEEVQWNITKEFQYQSSLELDPKLFELLRNIPLAEELIIHARQELVKRIENYFHHHRDLMTRVVDLIDSRLIPILYRYAISGSASINTEDTLLNDPSAVAILVDIFQERGFQTTVSEIDQYIPEKLDSQTGKIECRRSKLFNIKVNFTGNKIRRG